MTILERRQVATATILGAFVTGLIDRQQMMNMFINMLEDATPDAPFFWLGKEALET